MRPQLSWKSSRVSKGKSKRFHVALHLETREREADGPLAPNGLDAARRDTAARRLPPALRKSYSASELATARVMMVKLKQGKDQRPAKILSTLEALAEEDYESARRMGLVIDRLLDDLKE
jgi:hypothetical protein